jgi:predicted RNA binding protein YcfA (HicA-like mRNA interferase family)
LVKDNLALDHEFILLDRFRSLMSVYGMCILEAEGCAAMNSREVIRRLQQDGWFEVAQVGSHKQFKHPVKPGRVTVVYPKRDIPEGTLRSIEKQAGLKLR